MVSDMAKSVLKAIYGVFNTQNPMWGKQFSNSLGVPSIYTYMMLPLSLLSVNQ